MDRWLGNTNVIRAVAVLVGVLLWVIVRLDVQNSTAPVQPTTASQKYTNVSVQVVGLDENRYTLRSIEPANVNLSVIGTSAALRRVNIRDYQVVLDLSGATAGEQVVPLTAKGFPNNVDVVIDPPNVSVTLDEKQHKEVPVTIQVNGTPAEGFAAGEPVAQPNRVNVMVTSSLADKVDRVVGVVNISGARSTVKQQVKLAALDQAGNVLDAAVSPAVVEVEVPITSPFKTVPLQITLQGSTPTGFAVDSFEQSATEITIYGPQAYLDPLEFYEGFSIDLTKLTETKTFEFIIPLKGRAERVEPAKVTAKVTVVEAQTATLQKVPLSFNGRNDKYNYSFVTPANGAIDVPVEASPGRIGSITAKDVRAIVDVSNMPPGTHQIPVDYYFPSFVEVGAGYVDSVTVVVEAKDSGAGEEPAAPPVTVPDGGEQPRDQPATTEPEEPAEEPAEDPVEEEPTEIQKQL